MGACIGLYHIHTASMLRLLLPVQVASVDDIAEDGESVHDSELDLEDIIVISDDPHLHDESDCRRQYHDAIGKQLPTAI